MSGLVKQKEIKVEDSNMANVGSKEDKEARKEAAEGEDAWIGAGKNPGLQVWRINKFEVEHVPIKQYGKFFMGDSYIILYSYKQDKDSLALEYDLYFWIGKESTQDEYGTAAYKTVELDSFLDDKPVQHREVQDNESKEFRELFTNFALLTGGHDSGFTKVSEMEFETKLFRYREMKNVKKTAYLKECSHCEVWSKLIADHVYILETNDKIYIYQGSRSSVFLRFNALNTVHNSTIMQLRPQLPIETLDDNDVVEVFQEFLGTELPEDFDITRKKCKCKTEDEHTDDARLFRIDKIGYENRSEGADIDDIGTLIAVGDDIQNLDDLEIEENFLYILDIPGKEMVIHEKACFSKQRTTAAMIIAQEQLNKKPNKKHCRVKLGQVKEKSQFLKKCHDCGCSSKSV